MYFKKSRGLLFSIILTLWMMDYCNGQDVSDAKALRTQLFTTNGYDFRVRPVANQSQPIDVYIDFNLLAINVVNEVQETMQTTAFLQMSWADSELQWDPAIYGGIQEALWPQDDIWKPDVALTNSYVEHVPLGYQGLNVYNDYLGNISWSPLEVFTSTCPIDITYFPFDVQVCKMSFEAWGYKKHQIKVHVAGNGILLREYEPNPIWSIKSTSFNEGEDAEDTFITFSIKIQRHASYVMLNVFLPVLILSILNVCVFLLPCDSGEKNSYAITVFLSFAIFLTIVNGSLPQNADTVAYFQIYIIVLLLQSTMITMISLIFSRLILFKESETKIPVRLIKLSLLVRFDGDRRNKRKRLNNKIKMVKPKGNSQKDNNSDSVENGGNENGQSAEHEETWHSVVNGLDALCLVIFSVFTFVFTLLFIVIAPSVSATK